MQESSYSDSRNVAKDPGKGVNIVDRPENVFGTFGRATEFFIPESYRKYQRETIEAVESAFEQGYRYVIIDAPTGSGKSHIARAFAFQSGNTHILTVQKLLQTQYENEFPDMAIMKGRSAYRCVMGSEETGEPVTCADGPCRRRKVQSCEDCPYKLAKEYAARSPVTVHNFDSFYYQNTFGSGFSGRKLLIIDEAHNIPGKFSDFLSFTINSRFGVTVPKGESLEDYDDFIESTYKILTHEFEGLKTQFDLVGLDAGELKKMTDLSSALRKMTLYITEREKPRPEEYVFDYTTYGRYAPSVTFRPVNSGKFASSWLSRYGERVLMMSATILDKDIFCREVGLNPDEVCYIDVPSTFPPENSRVVRKYAGKMNFQNIDGTLPKIIDSIKEILERFPDVRGIIQTHSDKIANYIKDNLSDPRLTFNSDFPSPEAMLVAHRMKKNSFIVASGLREGLDLYGDMSKVQVFCKIPYPSLGDKVVARKLELSNEWYGWITSIMFVQAMGRSIRSPEERAVTYILDSGFGYFYTRYKRFIPNHVKTMIFPPR